MMLYHRSHLLRPVGERRDTGHKLAISSCHFFSIG